MGEPVGNGNVVYPPFRGKGYTDNYIGQLPLKYDGLPNAVDTKKSSQRQAAWPMFAPETVITGRRY